MQIIVTRRPFSRSSTARLLADPRGSGEGRSVSVNSWNRFGGGAGPGSHRDVTPNLLTDRQTDTTEKHQLPAKLRAGDNYLADLLIFQDR